MFPRPRSRFRSWRRSLPPPIEKRAEKAEKDLAATEGRAEQAEKGEKEAIEKMKDASSLARFICSDETIAKEFLTTFVNTEVGDKMVWIYG
nr:hypothetical protein Itr_chr10CG12980 [Ipomoea trifida]